jgi:hypothetical protein
MLAAIQRQFKVGWLAAYDPENSIEAIHIS